MAKPISFFDGRRIIHQAFAESMLDVPRHLARSLHELYFELQYDQFKPRTCAALLNEFTSAFNGLDPIPRYEATDWGRTRHRATILSVKERIPSGYFCNWLRRVWGSAVQTRGC